MKILIRDENDSGFRAVPIKIKIEGGSSYNIDVQLHREEGAPEPQVEVVENTTDTEEPFIADEAATEETATEIVTSEATTVEPSSELVSTVKDTAKLAKKAKRKPGAPGITKTIEIKITLPPLPKQLPSRQEMLEKLRNTSKRRLIAASSVITALLLIVIGSQIFGGSPSASVSGTKRPELQRGTPSFPTVQPAGKNINQLGGWVRISPPDRAPVYTYVDQIGTTQIKVSEQPLPQSFKADTPTSVSQLAQNFNATEKVTAGSTIVYIGTDEKGPQSVILSKNNLLILIKSADTISPTDWANYVNSLQ